MTAAAPKRERARHPRRARATFLRKYLIVFIFLGMCVLLALFSPNNSFLKPQNLINVVRQISVIGLLALGVMVCIISIGIDLSLGSVLGLSAVVAASFAQQMGWKEALYPGLQLPLFVAVLAGLAVGIVLRRRQRQPHRHVPDPTVHRDPGHDDHRPAGLAYIYSNGRPVSTLVPDFLFLGGGDIFGHPGARSSCSGP